MLRRLPFHYAWIVVLVTFAVLLFAAGIRTIPSVVIVPLETEFGWTRASLSFGVAISLFAFGFGGLIAGTLVDRFGARRVMLGGLVFTSGGLWLMSNMSSIVEFNLIWGIIVGVGTGVISNVIGAAVANRWFNRHRGTVTGLLVAASAAGQLIFLRSLVEVTVTTGWRNSILITAIATGILIIPVLLLMRDKPQDVGLEPVGGTLTLVPSPERRGDSEPSGEKRTTLREALPTRDFWLLAGSFFICGYTTNGMIGTHLLPHAVEHGFVELEAANAIAVMGFMNIFGTLASGWLSDRYDNRKLLAVYYGFRALSLTALPFLIDMRGLLIFSIIYGLDWVATVPPTVNLTAQRFGRASLATIYGWIFCSHMIGAGIAAEAGGVFRDWLGDYHLIFLSAALLGFVASYMALGISVKPAYRVQPQAA
ncbi:MAG: MFS transporter [Chloroflexota bacterium]|nr:MFS transporter [Chloroflexota bacterium]